MKKLSSKSFLNLIFPALIILVAFVLFYTNYQPGSFLSGWDTLHPEFNLALYIKRAFWGLWQGHQGVGAVASQAHAGEIPRLFIVYLLKLLLPLNLVRYSFFFLTLALGGLGVYFLAKYILGREETSHVGSASFLAALFYILNLATLQQYYVPLEMFAVHFASVPWLFFLATSYLREGKRRNIIAFAAVTVFASAMAHTETLFYVYFASFLLFILGVWIFVRRWQALKRGIALLALTLLLNLFWLAPNAYYVFGHASDVTHSKISMVFSDEAYLQSRAYGNFKDLGLLKNFLFNWREYSFGNGQFVDLMDEWNAHLDSPWVKEIGYSLTAFAIFGCIIALRRKSKYALALLPVALASGFFWLNSNPPFGTLFELLRTRIDLFREGLRFPFTKFSILLTMVLAVYLSYSAQLLMKFFSKIKLSPLLFVISSSLLVYFMLPAFRGNLISPSMKVHIPSEYFELFDWFETQDPSARVAKLPLNTFWGWNYYSWGYQGAGFTWFGIPQPTLDREFDRWSPYNESFYNEASFALYSNDPEAFEKTLEKYQVRYLLLDESVINAGGSEVTLRIPELKAILESSTHIQREAQFGFLTVYKTDFDLGEQYISAPETYVGVNADLTYSERDPIYAKYGTYVFDKVGPILPFGNLDPRGPVQIESEKENVTFRNLSADASLTLPAQEKIAEDLTQGGGFAEAVNCDLLKIGSVGKKVLDSAIDYTAEGGGVSCDFLDLSDLKYSDGYILHVVGKNLKGRSLKIYLFNIETKRMDLEELLPGGEFDKYFVVYPKKLEGAGYILNLETRSYGPVASENILQAIELFKLPIESITSLYFDTESITTQRNTLEIVGVNKLAPVAYLAEAKGEGLLTLSQGYEEGWIAFPVGNFQFSIFNFQFNIPEFGKKLEHVKVNSWENGWFVNNQLAINHQPSTIIVFFWPQLLEFGGMLIGIITLALVFRKAQKTS